MGDRLSKEDIRTAVYFIHEKGDVTRWCDWEKRKPLFERECPELVAALTALTVAERTLDAVLDAVERRFT